MPRRVHRIVVGMDKAATIEFDLIPHQPEDPAQDRDGRLRRDAQGELVPAAVAYILRQAGFASADAFREAVRAEQGPEALAARVKDYRPRGRKVVADPDWPDGRPEGWPPAPEPTRILMSSPRQVGVVRDGILAGTPLMAREQLDLATITEWHTGMTLGDILDAPRRNGKKGAAIREAPEPPEWHEEARKMASDMRGIKDSSKAARIADIFESRPWPGREAPKKDTIYKVLREK